MNIIGNLERHTIFVFVSIMNIMIVTSCASSIPALSEQSQIPKSATLPPPPPYIPYESYSGEANNVQKVLDSIRSKQHSDSPHSMPNISPPAYSNGGSHPDNIPVSPIYPHLPGYPANLTIMNSTSCDLGFYLQGPISRQLGLDKGKSVTLDITAGFYHFGFDTHLCPSNVPPILGQDNYEAGSSYKLTLSQNDIQPKTGSFVVENNTGAKLSLKINDSIHTVTSEPFSLELPVGSYTAEVSAKCGKRNETFDITSGSPYVGKYWCTGGEIITRVPEVGYFDVYNNTGGNITISVGGKTYKIHSGSDPYTIELPEGNYKAKISARCDSSIESFQVEGGSRYEGHYSCVSYSQ